MRGSISIEILLILLVAIYIAAVVYKGVIAAGIQFAKDEYKIATAKLAADKIASTAQFLRASAPGTTKKVDIYVPENAELRCTAGKDYIEINVKTERKYNNTACGGTNTCTGRVKLGLQCDKDWGVKGPARDVLAMVKIGGDKIRIGAPV